MVVPNLLVEVHAPPKFGKTHLAFTFPAPIVCFSFDLGAGPVLRHFPGKDITVIEYPTPVIMTSKPKPYALPIWKKFIEDFNQVIEEGKAKTLVIDTGTAEYEIARLARSEELGRSIVPYEYAEVYARLTGLMHKAQLAGVNYVVTHWMRDEYIDDKKTGGSEIDGYRRVIDYVDVSLALTREKRKDKVVVVTTIADNKYEMDLQGQSVDNCTYDDLIALLLGGTENAE